MVKKRQYLVVIRVVSKGSFGWLLGWLPRGSFGWLVVSLKRCSFGWF